MKFLLLGVTKISDLKHIFDILDNHSNIGKWDSKFCRKMTRKSFKKSKNVSNIFANTISNIFSKFVVPKKQLKNFKIIFTCLKLRFKVLN